GPVLAEAREQEVLVRGLVGRRAAGERDAVLAREGLQVRMVRDDHDELAVQLPGLALDDQLLEAVRLARDQHGDALWRGRSAGETDRHLHVDLVADPTE